MQEMGALLVRRRMDEAEVRRRMNRAPTLGSENGGTRCGCWLRDGPQQRWAEPWSGMPTPSANGPGPLPKGSPGHWFSSRAVVPPALDVEQRRELKAAVQQLPSQAGIKLSNRNWRAVRRFVRDRSGLLLSRSSCLNYLHRLGFVLKRPRKRLLKAGPARREAFVGEYAELQATAARTGARIFFADEAHFQADAGPRGKWVLKGEPASVSEYGASSGGFHQSAPR